MNKLELGEDDVLKMEIERLDTRIKIDLSRAEEIQPLEARVVRRNAKAMLDIRHAVNMFDIGFIVGAVLTVLSYMCGWIAAPALLWTVLTLAILILIGVVLDYALYHRLTLKALSLCVSLGPQNGSIK